MHPDQKQEIHQAMVKKIKALKKSIKTFGHLSKPVSPDNAIGRLTRMEAISSKNINAASLAKSKLTLKALEKALESIEDPDFGLCLSCQEPIPHKRLIIMPETSLCVGCAEKLNSGQK
ncbi:MAG: TraR/DksA C4-type zinc finger protein [Desulfobacter sp.]|nr:TraR/DksA C4-type zinc finger protein [Desulfobacter sp.]WDP85343.1 MAG: TraR/DksA C4-type zinc finger protein [Desulfobacter sp.]